MGLVDYFQGGQENDAYDQVKGAAPKATLSHQLIVPAAAFGAAKLFEDYCEQNGKPDSQKTEQLMAAFAVASVNDLVESKGLDSVNTQNAKHEAKKLVQQGPVDSGEC